MTEHFVGFYREERKGPRLFGNQILTSYAAPTSSGRELTMNAETVIISAVVGIITSAITAYVTTWLKMKEEKEKWSREFAIKYAEVQATDNARAQKMAIQFAIGVLIRNPEAEDRERIFIPPNCRLIAGRANDNPIQIDDRSVSRHHCAFDADDENVFVEELGSQNATIVNGDMLKGRRKLEAGDMITIGPIQFRFHQLDGR